RIGEVEDRVGEVVLAQPLGVVDDDASPSGGADPATLVVTKPVRHAVELLVRQLDEATLGRESAERASVLAEEDVGGRVVTLLEDLRGHLGGVAVADLHADAGGLLEVGDEGPDQLLVATRVD